MKIKMSSGSYDIHALWHSDDHDYWLDSASYKLYPVSQKSNNNSCSFSLKRLYNVVKDWPR